MRNKRDKDLNKITHTVLSIEPIVISNQLLNNPVQMQPINAFDPSRHITPVRRQMNNNLTCQGRD